jgi:Protein of unknown function (DUF2917)
MNSHQFPFATQDWTLGKNRALALQASQVKSVEALSGALWVTVSGSAQDFFVRDGEHITIPCTHGQVVIEALGDQGVVRVGQQAEAMNWNEQKQSFSHAVYVSIVCPMVRGLRKTADWLDPAPTAVRAAH